MRTCEICLREYPDNNVGKIPFIVCDEPCLCSKCVEDLEDRRLKLSREILIKDPEVVQMIQKTASLNSSEVDIEGFEVLYRHGNLMIIDNSESEDTDEFDEYDSEAVEDEDENSLEYSEVISDVLMSVREQDEAVKELGRIIFHNQRVKRCKKKFGVHAKKQNAFLIGPTGTGKTMSVTKLCENLDIPYVIVDSTELTQTGYIGRNIDDIFEELVLMAGGNISRAEGGIVVLDEFDKKESKENGTGPDISGKCVLDSLLKTVESKQIILKNGDVFDTTGVTFLALGVYPKLKQIRTERLTGKKTIGFSTSTEKPVSDTKYIWNDLEKHGVTKELCGRFPCIIEFSDFSREGYRDILLNSSDSEWKCQKELFSICYGVDIDMSDDGMNYVIDKAKSLGIGARGLNAVVTMLLSKVETDVLSGKTVHEHIVFGKDGEVTYSE